MLPDLEDVEKVGNVTLRGLQRSWKLPFGVTAAGCAVFVGALPAAYSFYEYPSNLYALALFFPAIVLTLWLVVVRPDLGWDFWLGRDSDGNRPVPLTGLVAVVLALCIALSLRPDRSPQSPSNSSFLQLVERVDRLNAAQDEDEDGQTLDRIPVKTLESRVAALEVSRTSTPVGMVAGDNAKPAAFIVVEGHCGPDDQSPTRVDVDTPSAPRQGEAYWLLRDSPEYSEDFAHGPPRVRNESPELTFDIFTTVCGREYRLRVLACGSEGDQEIRGVLASGPETEVESIPRDCVIVAEGTIFGVMK